MRILVTGATGFVGSALCTALQQQGHDVVRVIRVAKPTTRPSDIVVGDINGETQWPSLSGQDVIVHLAARVHVLRETTADAATAFRAVNVAGTLQLARQAALAGVKRFIFVSSIKVNGESTRSGCPYTAEDLPAPEDAYGLSKAEAEAGLRLVSQETGLEVVIIRPPLIYGPGVKGNFYALIRWIARGLPLPLGCATGNQRSLVALDNLVDLILVCLKHPQAANQTFLISDGEDLSTVELLHHLGQALGRPVRLLYIPVSWLTCAATLLGKQAGAKRLLGSLQVDIDKTRRLLNWKPLLTLNEGLSRMIGPTS